MKKNENQGGFFARIKAGKYYQAAQDGFWRVWKNKSIWFWGIFISAGATLNFNQNQEDPMSISEDYIINLFSNYWYWFLIGFLVLIVLVVVAWIISAIARAGVIRELNEKQNKKKYVLGSKKIWLTGKKGFKIVFGLDLYILGLALLILLGNLIVAIPLFVIENKVFPVILMVVAGFVSLLFLILIVILKPLATIYLLLSNLDIKDSFLKSGRIIKTKFKEFFKLILTCLVIGIVKGAIFGLISIFGVISAALFYAIIWGGGPVFLNGILVALGIVLVIVMLVLFLIIRAFFALWRMDILIWWVKMVDGAKAEKKVVEKITTKKKKVVEKKVAVGAGA